MNKRLIAAALTAFIAVSGTAQAEDDLFGCKVLLCLANPASNGGPKGVAECVDPINKLYDMLKDGKPFPSCDMADGGKNYAKKVYDPFDPCPTGTKPAQASTHIAEGTKATGKNNNNRWGSYSSNFTLSKPVQVSQGGALATSRACVGNLVGTYTASDCNDCDNYQVGVYDTVTWQKYQSPRAIDVFVDGNLFSRVRY